MRVGGQRHAPAALPLGMTQYPCMGGSVGTRAGIEGRGKSRHHRDSIPGFIERYIVYVCVMQEYPFLLRGSEGHSYGTERRFLFRRFSSFGFVSKSGAHSFGEIVYLVPLGESNAVSTDAQRRRPV
jgi:hypothetical protein